MFECQVMLALPLAYLTKPDVSPVYLAVGNFDFDPGLQVGEAVQISDWKIGWRGEKPFKGIASVVNRIKAILPKEREDEQDTFKLTILLEIADKEDLPRVCKIFRDLNPGTFVDSELSG